MVHEKHEMHEKDGWGCWYREECYQIQGAAFDVYREMGCGFLEAVYRNAPGFASQLRLLSESNRRKDCVMKPFRAFRVFRGQCVTSVTDVTRQAPFSREREKGWG